MTCTMRFAVLEPACIVNMTAPRYTPEICRRWNGLRPWHDPLYEPLRDLIDAEYFARFNAATGHFDKLLASVAREGIRNPVMLSAGKLERRYGWEVPPHLVAPDMIVSEYLGGSRIWAAQRLGLRLPAIVNDYAAVLPAAEVLQTLRQVQDRFADKPAHMERRADGSVLVRNVPFTHLPDAERYSMAEQIRIRAGIVATITDIVAAWLRAHDRPIDTERKTA